MKKNFLDTIRDMGGTVFQDSSPSNNSPLDTVIKLISDIL